MQETQLKKKAMGRQVLARKFPLKVYQEVDGGLVSSHRKSSSVSEEPSCLTPRLLEPEVIRWRQQTQKICGVAPSIQRSALVGASQRKHPSSSSRWEHWGTLRLGDVFTEKRQSGKSLLIPSPQTEP